MAAPRVDFYHPAREIDAALHAIERTVRRAEGIGLVVGPPGTGKSLLLAKLTEQLRDDFDIALLSGARICTRRALWQSVLAEVGEPYRGLDEGELRIGIVERIRGLAATGSGLVILVDEAHTLPSRLIEELRLLANVPTPLPAVHIVLAGTTELEERLGSSRMESVAQRIATRHCLEPLDHAETMAYLRTLPRVAGTTWEALFAPGCDDAVSSASEGVPRLINQLCDHALVLAAEGRRAVATTADIAAAWRDIQRLPPPGSLAGAAAPPAHREPSGAACHVGRDLLDDEFPADRPADRLPEPALDPFDTGGGVGVIEFGEFAADDSAVTASEVIAPGPAADPIHGPEVELVFDSSTDPFADFFDEDDDRLVERVLMQGPDDFSSHRHVASREGNAMARQLDAAEQRVEHSAAVASDRPRCQVAATSHEAEEPDDSDMVVIEEDLLDHPSEPRHAVVAVRPGDYRRLFARLRRGDA